MRRLLIVEWFQRISMTDLVSVKYSGSTDAWICLADRTYGSGSDAATKALPWSELTVRAHATIGVVKACGVATFSIDGLPETPTCTREAGAPSARQNHLCFSQE
jgi:hypothetical protein